VRLPLVRFTVRWMSLVAAVAVVSLGALALKTWLTSEHQGEQVQIRSSQSMSSPEAGPVEAISVTSLEAGPIEEISLIRMPGLTYPPRQYQKVVIRRDGSVTRNERGKKDGKYEKQSLHGSIGEGRFEGLEKLLRRQRYFSMQRLGYPMDAPYVGIRVSNQFEFTELTGQHAAQQAASPDGFNEIVTAIDELIAQVKAWR
jgi:hypothetical protein